MRLRTARNLHYGETGRKSGSLPRLLILHIDGGMHWRGSQHQVIHSLKGQIERGHDARLVCLPGRLLSSHAGENGIPTIEMPMGGDLCPSTIWRLTGIFRRLRPDVIHSQDPHAHVNAGIAGRLAGVPAIILSRRTDNRLSGPIARLKYRHFYDAVIAVSDGVKAVLIGAGVHPELITTVHSSVPDSLWERLGDGTRIRREFGISDEQPVISVIAHMEPRKGIEVLLDALPAILREAPDTRVLIVGGGSHRPVVERKARDDGLLSTVTFTGFRSDIPDILAATDLLVSPSILEGCCNALIEAMAAGKPVVGTLVGGNPEIVVDGVNGFLVPPQNPGALATAVIRVLRDRAMADRFGNEGRRIARERFSVDLMVDQTLAVYHRVLEERLRMPSPKPIHP